MGFLYAAIRVKDVKESVAFYKSMGLKVTGTRIPIPDETVISLLDEGTGQRLQLMHYGKKCRIYAPWKEDGVEMDHLMFEVKDAKKAFNKLGAKGAPIAMELFERDTETGHFAMGFVKDPNGIWVGVKSETPVKKNYNHKGTKTQRIS